MPVALREKTEKLAPPGTSVAPMGKLRPVAGMDTGTDETACCGNVIIGQFLWSIRDTRLVSNRIRELHTFQPHLLGTFRRLTTHMPTCRGSASGADPFSETTIDAAARCVSLREGVPFRLSKSPLTNELPNPPVK